MWVPGKKGDERIPDQMTMWVYVYKGSKKKKTMEQFILDGDSFFSQNEFKKALKEFKGVLFYNPLDPKVLHKAGVALIKMNQNKDACKYLQESSQYGNPEAEELFMEYCSH